MGSNSPASSWWPRWGVSLKVITRRSCSGCWAHPPPPNKISIFIFALMHPLKRETLHRSVSNVLPLNSHVTASGDTPANVRERTLLIAIHQFACSDEWLSNRIITNTCPLSSLLKIKIMPIFRLFSPENRFIAIFSDTQYPPWITPPAIFWKPAHQVSGFR